MTTATAPTGYDYTATAEVPCRECGHDTIPPTPGRPEEQGFYCEGCGAVTAAPEAVEARREFHIWEGNLEAARNVIAKVNRRAAKYGLSQYELEIGEGYDRAIHPVDPIQGTIVTDVILGYRRFYPVALVGEQPRIAGWTFVATLDLSEESGPITRVVPGVEIDLSTHRPRAGECDECGTVRLRTETFVLRHDDGTTKQVGRNCLQPYMGLNANALAWLAGDPLSAVGDLEDREERAGGSYAPDRFDVGYVLTVTMAVEQLHGWRSRAAAQGFGQTATSELVHTYLTPRSDRDREFATALATDADWDAAKVKATKVRGWALEQDGRGEWATNLRQLAGGETVTGRNVGLLASAVAGYNKAEGERVEREVRVAPVHVGTVGKREEFTGDVVHTYVIAGDYGDRQLVKVRTETGVLVWWASRITGLQIGDRVTGKATVKAHETYKDEAQTIVSRAAFETVAA